MTDRSVRCVRCGFPTDQCDCPQRKPISPWGQQTVSEPERPRWEFVPIEKTAEKHPDLYRLRVPGGWLYRLGLKSIEMTFVPER